MVDMEQDRWLEKYVSFRQKIVCCDLFSTFIMLCIIKQFCTLPSAAFATLIASMVIVFNGIGMTLSVKRLSLGNEPRNTIEMLRKGRLKVFCGEWTTYLFYIVLREHYIDYNAYFHFLAQCGVLLTVLVLYLWLASLEENVVFYESKILTIEWSKTLPFSFCGKQKHKIIKDVESQKTEI